VQQIKDGVFLGKYTPQKWINMKATRLVAFMQSAIRLVALMQSALGRYALMQSATRLVALMQSALGRYALMQSAYASRTDAVSPWAICTHAAGQ
jgi:hypothetical protein